jgi:Pvc16 N-terminal domain
VIEDVDESLRTLVRKDALNGSEVEVAFDAPTREWAARRNTPTVDLYLYDVREDLGRREVMWQDMRNEQGRVTERRPPPRYYRLSYLVTAWTQRPQDEHRILSVILTCFIRHQVLPEDVLTGALARSRLPAYASIALPPPQDRSLSDVWSALGGELKPSLDLVIAMPLDAAVVEQAAPPVLEEPRLRIGAGGEAAEEGAAGRPAREAATAAPEEVADETLHGGRMPEPGSPRQPGRVIRVRSRPRPRR